MHCSSCEKPLRASRTKGNTKLHPYYLCHTKGCSEYGKSIRRDQLEGDFEALLKTIQPTKPYTELITAMFKDAWDIQMEKAKDAANTFKAEVIRVDKEIETFLSGIMNATNARVIETYENKIAELEYQKLILEDKSSRNDAPRSGFSEMLELSLTFLANPYKLWAKGSYDMKRTVLKLAFSGPLYYTRNQGARTPVKALIHKAFTPFSQGQFQNGAAGGNRTPDLPLTRRLHYRCATTAP